MNAGWLHGRSFSLLAETGMAGSSATLALSITIHTLIFFFGISVIWWGRRKALAWIKRQTVNQLNRLGTGHRRRINLRELLYITRLLVRLLSLALLLAGLVVWVTGVLDALPFTHEVGRQIERTLLSEVMVLMRGAIDALPGVGVMLLIFFLARAAADMVGYYFRAIESGESESDVWDPITAQTTRRLSTVGIWIAAVIIAYPYIPGSQSAAFKGVSILAGLMLSLGSTNLVGQLVSGLVLIYSRAVRPGDVIAAGPIEGTVEKIGLFSCALRTANDEIVWLPNSALAAGLHNYSRPGTRESVRFTTQVTIGYDAPWQQVRELLLGAAEDAAGVRKEPAPLVRQVALEDFYVRYELVFAPEDPSCKKAILSDLHAAILERFHHAGVQIMSPHYLGDPAKLKIPPATTRKP